VCFREELGEHIVITSMDKKWVSVYSKDNWQKAVVDRVEENALKSSSWADMKRLIMSCSYSVEVDSTGRILLPEPMRKEVGIVQDVFIVGNANKIEIWDSGRWRKFVEETGPLLSELQTALPGL
jgi:MraZ protein